MVRFFGLVVMFATLGAGAFAVSVASLTSLEGEVTVLRAGLFIPSERIAEGFPLEAFDTVTTGPLGRAEVRLPGTLGVAGGVRLDPNTSLYWEASPARREQTVGVELLMGSVSVQITSTVGSSSVEVRTGSGTFSGQGPSFRVVLTGGGDTLAVVSLGQLLCQGPQRTLTLEPGVVLETSSLDGSWQTIPVNVTTLEAFEGTWIRQHRQILRDQVAVFFRTLASRYQRQGSLFQRAWDRYQRESKDDAKAIKAATSNLRRAASPLERSIFQIKTLKGLLDDGSLSPSLELNRGYPAKDFFRQATLDEPIWSSRLAEARGFYKSLFERSGGFFPQASDGAGITWDSDFFH